MYWSHDMPNPFDEPFGQVRERLRHLVFLDGRLIDTWTEHVEGTVYRSVAEEFDREKRIPHHVAEPVPPPYERVLTWLDAVVGGRIALLALDDEPLDHAPLASENDAVVGFLRRVSSELFDAEYLVATRAALATVRSADPDLLDEAPADEIAAGLCWLLGRANGLVGAGTGVTQQVLKRVLESNASPSKRAPRLKACLRGLVPEPGWRPSQCPDLMELGDPAYLTSATRRRLIVLRDRALATAEHEEADQQARAALNPSRVDSLPS